LQNDGQPSSMLDRDWGVEAGPPQTHIFSHQCGGHLQPVGVLNPPTPDKSNAGDNGTPKGTSLRVNTSYDVQIVKIRSVVSTQRDPMRKKVHLTTKTCGLKTCDFPIIFLFAFTTACTTVQAVIVLLLCIESNYFEVAP